MKLTWFGLSDEEYIDRLRKVYHGSRRWMWPMIIGNGLLAMIGIGVIWSLKVRGDRIVLPTPIAMLPGDSAFIAGMVDAMMWFAMPLMLLSAPWIALCGTRTWRLLLDYHDRLQHAGLLSPPESNTP